MTDQLVPPPLPPDEKGAARARKIASYSMAAPALFLGLCLLYQAVSKAGNFTPSPHIMFALGAVCVGLLLSGGIAAIYGLVSIRQFGRQGLLRSSSFGLLANFALMTLFVLGAIKGYKNKVTSQQEFARLSESLKDIRNDMKNSIDSENSIDSGSKNIKRLEQEFEKAGKNLSGTDQKAMQINATFARLMGGEAENFQKAAKVFQDRAVLAPASNKSLDMISTNRVLVEKFINANQSFAKFLQNADKHYEKIIADAKLSSEDAKKILTGFNQGFGKQKPLIMEIRKCDTDIGNTALAMLELFSKYHGQWRINDDGRLIMPEEAIEPYNQLLEKLDEASERQSAAQKKFFQVAQQPQPKK